MGADRGTGGVSGRGGDSVVEAKVEAIKQLTFVTVFAQFYVNPGQKFLLLVIP